MVPDFAPANVIAALVRRIEKLERDQRETASTGRTLEAAWIGAGGLTIAKNGLLTFLDEADRKVMVAGQGIFDQLDPDTGGGVSFRNGRILLWDNYLETPNAYGQIMVDQGAGKNLLRVFPPFDDGTGLENSFTIRGKTPTQAGAMWAYTDGNLILDSDLDTGVYARKIGLVPSDGVISLFNLPTTSGGYLLRYNEVGGDWTMALDSSSRRYKTNEQPVDRAYAATVLQWEPTWFQMTEEVNLLGADRAPRYLGFIAEQIDDHTPEVVVHDSQGRADALNKADMVAGLHVVAQVHHDDIAALKAENTALREQVAAEKKARGDLEVKVTAHAKTIAALTAGLKKLGVTI